MNGRSDADVAKSNSRRFLHYYNRFHSHSQAQDLTIESAMKIEGRMIHFQEQNPDAAWIDVEFLEAANRQLVECRRVLKYSYAFAYYLQDGDTKTLFEYHQLNLERFTENLSKLTEKPIQDINRTEVVDQVRLCLSRVRKVIHVGSHFSPFAFFYAAFSFRSRQVL
jgi:ariadne-1